MPESFYQQIGGEEPLRRLVDRFYQLMDELPEAREVRDIHPPDLAGSADKLFKFLSGWAGGPPLYEQQYGHPRLRRRHMHITIGEAERDQWMLCMDRAMQDCGLDPRLRHALYQALYNTADFMRNKPASVGQRGGNSGGGLARLRIQSA